MYISTHYLYTYFTDSKCSLSQLYVYTACSAAFLLVEKEMLYLREISMCSDIFIRISRSISFDE